MNTTTTPSEPTPVSASKGLDSLSEDEFKLLISNGGTLTIGQINTRLAGPAINASVLEKLGIGFRRDRGAVHIDANEFQPLCRRLSAHILLVIDGDSLF